MILARSQQVSPKYIICLLIFQVVTAFPAESFAIPLPRSPAAQGDSGDRFPVSNLFSDSQTLPTIEPIKFGGYIIIGIGILFVIFQLRMPKTIKEKRRDRAYRASPMGLKFVGDAEEDVQANEKPLQEYLPGYDVNKIWLDAIRKDRSTESSSNDRSEPEKGRHEVGANDFMSLPTHVYSHRRCPTLPPLRLTEPSHRGPGPWETQESQKFGENPNYHDEGFQYSPTYPNTDMSTPPSPFSSRFYDSNIKKVKSHRRSKSLPSAYQTFQASMGFQSNSVSSSHFPLPTLRPVTPPELMSIPPLAATHQEEPLTHMSAYRYTRWYIQRPHDQQHQHVRAHSTPLPEVSPQRVSTPVNSTSSIGLDVIQEGQTETVEAQGARQDVKFQPVMIFEQGQTVTGQKWKRKVTVFRSEILERLEKEGLVIHGPEGWKSPAGI